MMNSFSTGTEIPEKPDKKTLIFQQDPQQGPKILFEHGSNAGEILEHGHFYRVGFTS
jgi:hypothetical protein